jgi:hypothetical protein
MIKWRRIRWAAHIAGMGENRNAHGILVTKARKTYTTTRKT